MLSIPVTLRQEHRGRQLGVEITTCCMPAESTMLDLQTALEAQLGSKTAITSLSYKGCKPGLHSPLQDCAISTVAPHFQVSYEDLFINVHVKLPGGKQLQLSVRANHSLQDVQKQLKASLGADSFSRHRLLYKGRELVSAMLWPGLQLELEQGLSLTLASASGEEVQILAFPAWTGTDLMYKLRTEGICGPKQRLMLGTEPLSLCAALSSSGVREGCVLTLQPLPPAATFSIVMKFHTRTELLFRVQPHTTVGKIIAAIPDSQSRDVCVMFDGQRAKAHCTLAECGVEDGDVLEAFVEQRGGGGPAGASFADVSNTGAMEQHSFVDMGPSWRNCYAGLHIEGVCTSASCPAFNEMVIDCKGMCCFNLLRDTASCPECHEPIQPVTCAFVGCAWTFDGRKLGPDGSVVTCSADWQEVSSDFYHRFQEDDNTVDWLSLVISVRRYKAEFCPICFEPTLGHQTRTPCSHMFHADCLAAWRRYASAPTCPVCRGSLGADE